MKRRQLLSALPTLAAVLAIPQLVQARTLDLPHVNGAKLADMWSCAERQGLRVTHGVMGRQAFECFVRTSGKMLKVVQQLGVTYFRLWGAWFILAERVGADEVLLRVEPEWPAKGRLRARIFAHTWSNPYRFHELPNWGSRLQHPLQPA
jgi:hypothetical protein